MLTGKTFWKPVLQKLITGHWGCFRLVADQPPFPRELKQVGLYLHVPFCRHLCPFCPYHRITYDPDLFKQYEEALYAEIDLYEPHLRKTDFISLYIGGGTPTVHLPGLIRILNRFHEKFGLAADICIELHPGEMSSDCLTALKDNGVTMVSIGVESTSDRLLERIRRSHDGQTAINALQRAVLAGFDAVNADLMFALPTQTISDWKRDVRAVVDAGVDQISTYPLFSFPYSDLGQAQKLKRIKRPNRSVIRSMLAFTDRFAQQNGYDRCAVWSWLKPSKKKFSSITRHHYVGFGPSAATMTGTSFYVNTFNVAAYINSLPERRPVALSMPVDRRLEMAYWLYWRVYELNIDDSEFQSLFGKEFSLNSIFSTIIHAAQWLGMMKHIDGTYRITPSGAYWIHRLQNEYSLNYINRLWGTCRRKAWPLEVTL